VVVSAGQDGCRWRRLNLGEGGGRRVSVGEEKMEEMDGKGWKKLTALIFFLTAVCSFLSTAISHP
jgi:hypothetical protein